MSVAPWDILRRHKAEEEEARYATHVEYGRGDLSSHSADARAAAEALAHHVGKGDEKRAREALSKLEDATSQLRSDLSYLERLHKAHAAAEDLRRNPQPPTMEMEFGGAS